MDGVLVVDKPAGMTSHDVVDRIRRTFHTRKVGHGGTLDPDATGLLILGIGRATRFLAYSQGAPKSYDATVAFGSATSTQDASGEVLATRDASKLTADAVLEALDGFKGDIQQIPPMVSAVKVDGERLYKKAQRGEEVERAPRPVTIYDLTLESFTAGGAAEAQLHVTCSGGTYVRTLAHDVGAKLGCGAHLVSLRRSAAGGFTLADSVPLEDVNEDHLRPLVDAVRQLPAIEVDEAAATAVSFGRSLSSDLAAPDLPDNGCIALIKEGVLLAVYKKHDASLKPDRVVSA